MSHVERIGRTLVRKGAIVDVYEDEMRLPDGTIEKWDFIHHRMGAAAVVAVTKEGRILLVQQYRPALERMAWELPAGCRDAVDEPMEITAKRELLEETGYSCGDDGFQRLLSLKTTVAFTDEVVDVFLAKPVTKVAKQHLDPAEEITIREWDLKELLEEIYAGRIQDGKTVAGVLAYYGKLH